MAPKATHTQTTHITKYSHQLCGKDLKILSTPIKHISLSLLFSFTKQYVQWLQILLQWGDCGAGSFPIPHLRQTWSQEGMSIISQAFIFHFCSCLVLLPVVLLFRSLERWSHLCHAPQPLLPKQCIYLTKIATSGWKNPRQTEIVQEFPRKLVWTGGDAFDWQQPRGNRTRLYISNT